LDAENKHKDQREHDGPSGGNRQNWNVQEKCPKASKKQNPEKDFENGGKMACHAWNQSTYSANSNCLEIRLSCANHGPALVWGERILLICAFQQRLGRANVLDINSMLPSSRQAPPGWRAQAR
jgi:hypothetical protein